MALRSIEANGGLVDESSLVRLYMELTGATESQARNVFMHVYSNNDHETDSEEDLGMETLENEQPTWNRVPRQASVTQVNWGRIFPMSVPNPVFQP